MNQLPIGLKVWPAPAKLNLFLHITGQRADGYHELQSVFQMLDWGDELAFEVTSGAKIQRITQIPGVPEQDDLVVKAAQLLQSSNSVSQGVKIHLNKRLPMGGGLGGGSSDAATTLVALNQLWDLNLKIPDLMDLGLQLGADVPVFINGYSAWAEGIGEQLKAIQLPKNCYLVANPGVHVSTAELFSATELTRDCDAITIRAFLGGAGMNVFEPLVKKRYPEVASIMDWLDQFATAKLTGTGGCIFAAFPDQEQAHAALQALPENVSGFVACGVNESPLRRAFAGNVDYS